MRRGAAFIIVVVSMVIIFTAGIAYLSITKTQSDIASNLRDGMRAFYAAEAGLADAMNELLNDFDAAITGSPYTSTYDARANYTFGLDQDIDSPGKITITGTGICQNARRTVNAEVIGIVPFAYAVVSSTGGDFTIASTSNVTLNDNILVGGDYNVGNPATVTAANVSITSGIENFTVGSPSFTDYESNAGTTYGANTTFSDQAPLDPDYFGIHYVTGNATIDASSPIDIDGAIVCTGTLTITGGSRVDVDPETSADNIGNAALIAGGNITLASGTDVDIDGFVYSGGSIVISGDCTVDGQISLDGNLTINGADATVTLTNPQSERPWWWNYDEDDIRLSIWRGH